MKDRPAVVMGLGPSGLFLVRQLRRITENIYAVGRNDDVGMFSRYINRKKRYYAQTEDTVFAALENIRREEGARPLVYLCSDQYLTMLINAKRDPREVCELAGTDLDTLGKINDKAQINRYCAENGILIPETEEMAAFCAKEYKAFPVIVKWKEKDLEARSNPVGKTLVCRDEEQFARLLSELEASWVTPEMLLVQPFIPGDNGSQYSVGGYYKDGEPLAFVTVRQPRQFPQGISAQVYSADGGICEKAERIAFDLAKRFRFSGFLETEFKADENTGAVYLLDVNPRPWGWVSILGAVYEDFYKVLENKRPESPKQNAIWTSPVRNALSSKNPANAETEQKALLYKKAADIADSKDRLPGLMLYFMALKKKLKR